MWNLRSEMDTPTLDLPVPVANRLRRPGWRDPRLLVGIGLVAGSVALGSWVVQSAQQTTDVYVAREALTPGAAIESARVGVAHVRLDVGEVDRYLTVADGLPADLVVQRVVGAGELVPRSALGGSTDLDVRPVAVPVAAEPSQDVAVGTLVDLWQVPSDAAGAAAPTSPTRELASGLTVAQVRRPDGAFTVGGTTVVYVLVPTNLLAEVLAAVASDGSVQVVPVPGMGS